ncbi:MAG: tetratricopeptide repeat protein [Candidatus Krumholzibacteriota bacterium]|nr:tetratricopeptide repeat protein [Candidatus Krumholzibacteriota bacterium]
MFLTQEKVLKKIQQDRLKGDLKQALQRALDAHAKWPDDFGLTLEAIQLSFERSDYKQSVTLMKDAIRRNPKKRSQIMGMARETLQQNFSPFLASFILEILLRSRNIDDIRHMFGYFSNEFIDSLIKRSSTRSKGFLDNPGTKNSQFTDNELLLGLLYMASGRSEKAVQPFERAFDNSPEDIKLFGRLFIELERELPEHSGVKFDLGRISLLLSHPEKAEVRFFQAIQLDSPPLDELLLILESAESRSEKHLLLTGEILIRSGREDEGEKLIREYLESNRANWKNESFGDNIKQLFPDKVDGKIFVFDRLSRLPERFQCSKKIVFLFCELAEEIDRSKELVEKLESLFEKERKYCKDIASWIEEKDSLKKNALAQKLLSRIYIDLEDYSRASTAAILAAEINPGLINSILKTIEEGIASAQGNDTRLLSAQAELHTLNGNSEKAEQIIGTLEDKDDISNHDLFRLTGRIIEKSGINLDRVVSLIEMDMRNDDITETLPYFLEFYRENTEEHGELSIRIEELLSDDQSKWEKIVSLIEAISKKEDLSRSFRLLRAKADIRTGRIEKAVFEFDQLMMFDNSLGLDLIEEYERAAVKHSDNTTLNLALYQLYLDDRQYAAAARYLCKSLESDPQQIRDVISRFNDLVKKDAGNRKIWEELLKSALKVGHIDLAGEILGRAFTELPKDDSAPLHIYGARISASKGDIADSLLCISKALTAKDADLRAILEELSQTINREPNNPEARYLIGDAFIRLGNEDEAIKELEKCLSLSWEYSWKVGSRLEELLPISIKPWLISKLLGTIAWKEDRLEDAYRYFNAVQNGPVEFLESLDDILESIRKDHPDDRQLTLISGRSLSLQGKYDEAAELLYQLLTEDPGTSGRIMDILMETLDKDPSEFHANRLSARIFSSAGEGDKILEPAVQILKNKKMGLKEIDKAVREFLPLLEENVKFIIPYSELKSSLKKHTQALSGFRRALEIDRSRWQDILSALGDTKWPEETAAAVSILKVDCYLEGEKADEAFAMLKEISDRSNKILPKMIESMTMILKQDQRPEYYIFGSRLLVETGDADGAEELIRDGYGRFDEKTGIDLKIGLADALEGSDRPSEAARIYKEILEESSDKSAILGRIEQISSESARKEISIGMTKLEDGTLDPELSVKLAGTALDLGEFETALKFAKTPGIPDPERALINARTYLYMGRPLLALALAGSIEKSKTDPTDTSLDLLLIEGIASERLGDYGRAAAAFSRLVGKRAGSSDCDKRAEINYTRFLESEFENNLKILVKTGDLESDRTERNSS